MHLLQSLPEGWGKLRRWYLVHFRPSYVKRMQALRRGECRRCGACCSIAFRCPHLANGNHCTIYEHRYMQCRLFPIDERDLRGRFRGCGFWFQPLEQTQEVPDAISGDTQAETRTTH